MKEHKKNRTVLIICFSVILFMGGLSLAAVPLYELFCKVTGYKGTPNIINVASSESGNRDFIMRYDVNISPELNWKVIPDKTSETVTTGDNIFTFYNAKNEGILQNNGIATYNVIPAEAAAYILKVECFCFLGQELSSGEEMRMPLTYYIDPAIDRDEELKNVDTITISYTFLKIRIYCDNIFVYSRAKSVIYEEK